MSEDTLRRLYTTAAEQVDELRAEAERLRALLDPDNPHARRAVWQAIHSRADGMLSEHESQLIAEGVLVALREQAVHSITVDE